MASAMVEDATFEDDQLANMTTDDIVRASRLLDNEIRILKEELQRTNLELESYKDKIKENQEKIKLNKQLPYLVGNIVEILEMNPEDEAEEDGANIDLDSQRKGKCVVLKTSTRQTIFLPVVGLVDPDKLKPGDLVGVNKDSYLILDTLPSEYDSRVKAMEVDEKPTEDYNDIGGLEKQIQELVEAIVLPMTHKERFQKLGVRPPKGVLLYGPPGTGKTLMARACAAQTNATFLKLAGPQLVQMFIGDGAKLVRDAFQLAKEKSPCIIFIDEIDAIGTKRFDSSIFIYSCKLRVIAATNRADILDPPSCVTVDWIVKLSFHTQVKKQELVFSGFYIHSRKMNVHRMSTLKNSHGPRMISMEHNRRSVRVEVGMLALRRDATEEPLKIETLNDSEPTASACARDAAYAPARDAASASARDAASASSRDAASASRSRRRLGLRSRAASSSVRDARLLLRSRRRRCCSRRLLRERPPHLFSLIFHHAPPLPIFLFYKTVVFYYGFGSAKAADQVNHEDFNEGIIQVQAKKKASLNYYA
ncbi:hypothetical protein ACSQ67_015181 [Phaseolus vulgaris]